MRSSECVDARPRDAPMDVQFGREDYRRLVFKMSSSNANFDTAARKKTDGTVCGELVNARP